MSAAPRRPKPPRTSGAKAQGSGHTHAAVLASAARAVADVASRGRSADDALAPAERSPERPAIRAIALGSLRWYWRLHPAISVLLRERRPLAPELSALLVTAAHQIEHSRSIPQTVANAAVDAARLLGEPRASGLVNAVLRRFVSERAALFAKLDADLAVATAHPEWLAGAVASAWPAEARAILEANDAHPPFVLRVDLTRGSVADYLTELAAAGLEGRAVGSWAPAAIELSQPVPVRKLPGFVEGRVSVQDAGAQLAAPLLDARAGMRVLDACAAPGGKTLHLLEHTPALAELIAADVSSDRLRRVEENLQRAGRHARLVALDVREIATPGLLERAAPAPRDAAAVAHSPALAAATGSLFDRILLDAPCSSTGVIRRHPDIKLLRRPGDIESYAAVQLEILRAAFQVLAPGGRLLYCTCSVLPAENDERVRSFLAAEPSARPAPMPPAAALAPGARDRPVGVQLLPGAEAGTDGFYYACLEKTTAGN